MPSVRRLTAILAADVAGYSRLMGLDEEGPHVVEDLQSSLPDSVRIILKLLVDAFIALEAQIAALDFEISPMAYRSRLLNNLSPRNRALGYRRVIPLIGIAPIPDRRRGCPGIRGVTIASVIGSRC
jgi:hypothetical protein